MHVLSNHLHSSSCLVKNPKNKCSRDNQRHFGTSESQESKTKQKNVVAYFKQANLKGPNWKWKKQHVSTWYVDSGCSRHMTGTLELLSSYVNKEGSSVAFGGNQKEKSKDGLKHNLISVSQLCDNGMDVKFTIKFCILYKDDTLIEIMRANRRGDLYLLCFESLDSKEEICLISSVKNEEAWLWHTRFCHLNFHTLAKLVKLKLVKGLPNIKFEKDHLCSACEMGKLKRSSHRTKSDPSFDKPLMMLHVDLCGPIAKQSLNGKKYILVLIDEFSRYTWVEFVKKKSHVPLLLINLMKRLQVFHGVQVRVIRSDNGSEFKNSTIEDYLTSVGITHNFSAQSTPQQNGVVERKNRTLVEAARTMLNASGLPLSFWAEAVSTACYTQNRSLVVKRQEKTPYQLLYNKRPNIKFFHVFGCKCFVLNDRESIGKFDPKGDDAIFIGYAWDSVAYRVFVPRLKIVVVSTNVKFNDSFQATQDKFSDELKLQAEASPNATITKDLANLFHEWYEDFEDHDKASASDNRTSANVFKNPESPPKASTFEQSTSIDPTSSELLEPIHTQQPVTSDPTSVPTVSILDSPSPNPSFSNVENPLLAQEPEEIISTVNMPHITKWTRAHPQTQIIGEPTEGVKTRANVNYCLFACFVSTIEPKKVPEALADPFWVEAMQEELLQFERNHVWTLTPLPNGKIAISTKWVFRNKKDENGVVIRNKARLVA
ncbi:hypothetical protein OSB04_006481 [Centaurea solstitialis]|uniref:Integrase catalytic domain-containing protein n=1 Tax=Centaurea solstitialis TaxID=347529 RepID=A0AA38WSP9_9ASTR|nr:hypothetical protein OSB04_006481 [Centaurea solstitialis]